MFIDRKEEMGKLDRLLRRGGSSLVVCRGRRRIGKSTLIQRFGATCPNFYEFQGLPPRDNISNADQLLNFSRSMSEQFELPAFRLDSWHDAFALLANQKISGEDFNVVLSDWRKDNHLNKEGFKKILNVTNEYFTTC